MASRSLRIWCLALLGFSCLFGPFRCVGLPLPDTAELKTLFESRRWFELREAVADRRAPAFYQGVVACAFNELQRCERILGKLFRSHPPFWGGR